MSSFTFADIGLPPSKLRAVTRKAKRTGRTAVEYVRFVIERDLLADRTFDEILRPVRREFRKSGVTPEQLDAIVDRARADTRPKRRGTPR